jgi:hypothetical protein
MFVFYAFLLDALHQDEKDASDVLAEEHFHFVEEGCPGLASLKK